MRILCFVKTITSPTVVSFVQVPRVLNGYYQQFYAAFDKSLRSKKRKKKKKKKNSTGCFVNSIACQIEKGEIFA